MRYLEDPGSWLEFRSNPKNKKLSLHEATQKFKQEQVLYVSQQPLHGGVNSSNSIIDIYFTSNYNSGDLGPNNSVTNQSGGVITPLPLRNGFTASIVTNFKHPVKITGTPKITTVTNNGEGNYDRSPRGNLEFTYNRTINGDKSIEFIYVQPDPPVGNQNIYNMRASQILLQSEGDGNTHITDLQASLNDDLGSFVIAEGIYPGVTLHWGQGSTSDLPSGSNTPSDLSASIHVDSDGDISKIIPNSSGTLGAYTEYSAGNIFSITASEFGMAGSGSLTLRGEYVQDVAPDFSRYIPYPSGSTPNTITVYSGIYGDVIYIEDEIGNNGRGEINIDNGSVINKWGGPISLDFIDNIHTFGVFALD